MTEIQFYRKYKRKYDPREDSRLSRFWHGYLVALRLHGHITERELNTEKKKLYKSASVCRDIDGKTQGEIK